MMDLRSACWSNYLVTSWILIHVCELWYFAGIYCLRKLMKFHNSGSPYEIKTVTSDISGAGTNEDIFVCIYGEGICTEEHSLEPDKQKRKKVFNKGQTDAFLLEVFDFFSNSNDAIFARLYFKGIQMKWNGSCQSETPIAFVYHIVDIFSLLGLCGQHLDEVTQLCIL